MQEKEKLGAGAGDQGEGGVYSPGVWGFQWTAGGRVRRKRGWLEGGAVRGQGEDITLRSKSRGECFCHKHLRRKQTKAWNGRQAAHAWKMGQRRAGDS